MALANSQERFDERFRQGGSLAQVEQEIIDSAPSGEEQRAALWLYASASIPRDVGGGRCLKRLGSPALAWFGLAPPLVRHRAACQERGARVRAAGRRGPSRRGLKGSISSARQTKSGLG